jgi:kynurenine formamidase
MEKVPPILTRGVLVDIPRFKGRDLGPTEEISLADFKACLKKEGVELRPGDALIVHTGWMERYLGKDDKTFASSNPGIVEDIAWYLVEKGIVGIGTDQWCTEAFPHPGFPKDLYNSGFVPCHCILLGNGIHLFQNVRTEELAKACAQDGKYEFFFAFTHPKIRGTVQGIGQPVAVK